MKRKKIINFEFLNRYWRIGWASPEQYVKHYWIFNFTYYNRMVWQIMILGFYLTSTYVPSVLK